MFSYRWTKFSLISSLTSSTGYSLKDNYYMLELLGYTKPLPSVTKDDLGVILQATSEFYKLPTA